MMTHVDGSVRFYGDDISAGDLTQGQTGGVSYAGASQRGVIGALGTISGGEGTSHIINHRATRPPAPARPTDHDANEHQRMTN